MIRPEEIGFATPGTLYYRGIQYAASAPWYVCRRCLRLVATDGDEAIENRRFKCEYHARPRCPTCEAAVRRHRIWRGWFRFGGVRRGHCPPERDR